MNNSITIYMTILIALVFMLMAFAIFAIGFLIGYKSEDNKIIKRKQQLELKEIPESEKEKKAKKEWKNFLEYDGSAPLGRE